MQLGVPLAKRRRSYELIFGKEVSKHMGLFHTVLPQGAIEVEEEPPFRLDLCRSRKIVSSTIREIKGYFGKRDDPHGMNMFDWSEYEATHTCESMLNSLIGICKLDEIKCMKVGIATCPLWRMTTCDGKGPHKSMISHWQEYNYVYILLVEHSRVAAFREKYAIKGLRDSDDPCVQKKVRNIKDGADGTIRDHIPMYLYAACKLEV